VTFLFELVGMYFYFLSFCSRLLWTACTSTSRGFTW